MLSHERRNPLAAVRSATRILNRTDATSADCREASDVVARQANHMARLLDDLLDVARITRGRIVLRREPLDLRETARSAIEALGPFMAERQTRLTLAIGDTPLVVNGDLARLQQIQANLLGNASKYSGRGGRVTFELLREGDEAVIRVSDNGRGIEPEMLPRIFDSSSRASRRWRGRRAGSASGSPCSAPWSSCTTAGSRSACVTGRPGASLVARVINAQSAFNRPGRYR